MGWQGVGTSLHSVRLSKAELAAGGKAGSRLTEWCGSGGGRKVGVGGKPSAGNGDKGLEKGREEEERKDGRRQEGEKLMTGVKCK